MEMHDVDFEFIYEPGKYEADPLDFLSRHPLPITGKDAVENVVKHVIFAEHAVVEDIREETLKDDELQKLSVRILTVDWDKHEKDAEIEVRHELSIVDDRIFRTNRLVIPTSLQGKLIKAAHNLGHLGMTKTKQMLREKYRFPTMKSMVEQIIGQCFECQVTTKQHRQEPVKVSDNPKKPDGMS